MSPRIVQPFISNSHLGFIPGLEIDQCIARFWCSAIRIGRCGHEVSDSFGGYLDDVQLNPRQVSEPSAVILFGVGSLALARLGRWRKKAA
jgi:hypothetical protein